MGKEMKKILKIIDFNIKNLDDPMSNNTVKMNKESNRTLKNTVMLDDIDLRLKNLEYRIQKLENLKCKHFTG